MFCLHCPTLLHSSFFSSSQSLSFSLCIYVSCPCPISYFHPLTIVNSTLVRLHVAARQFGLTLFIPHWMCTAIIVLLCYEMASSRYSVCIAGCLFLYFFLCFVAFDTCIRMVNRNVQCAVKQWQTYTQHRNTS